MDYARIALDASADRPLYRQLEGAIEAAITAGDLATGERLPSERALAERFGVSRTTAVNAYRELESRGLVRGQVGRGTYVCAPAGAGEGTPFAWSGKLAGAAQRTTDPGLRTLVRRQPPQTVSFAAGSCALDLFPTDVFRLLTERVLRRDATAALGLGPTEGQPRFRETMAARYRTRPEKVLALSGSQQGIDLVARCLLDPGDAVIVDRPGDLGAIQAFRAAGARLVGWDVRRADPEELEDLVLRYRPKLLFTNPSFQNPTGTTMPAETRQALLEIAARYKLPLIEDEPYRELSFGPPPPTSLRELDDHALVIQLGTFSKTLAPGLRLGWLIAPSPIVDQLALVRQRSDVFPAGLPQLVVADLVASGAFDAHLKRLRAEHAKRYMKMVAALRQLVGRRAVEWSAVEGGLYLWLRLRQGLDAGHLADRALAAGVAVVAGPSFYADGAGRDEVRLSFGGVPPDAIGIGIERLAGALVEIAGEEPRSAGSLPLV
ncbi:MAG TPA: PLP-dependent aminotransferase family protein [Thermomicrobiales bacterium]|nr:PLP-dependent aminotransferase family protein [Thermomicrobiales bacterium]